MPHVGIASAREFEEVDDAFHPMFVALVSATALRADQARTDSLRLNNDDLRPLIAATADNPRSETGISGRVTIRPVRPHATL